MIVDSHVNLHGEKFADDLEDTILRAREAGVGPMLNICCHLKDFENVLNVANRDPNIWATVGTHPHDAKDNPDIQAAQIIELTKDPKVVDMLEMLQSAYKRAPFTAIMHCYTSGQRLADAAAEMGFYFSVSGIMTFKNAHEVRERILNMPKDRIMLETDCPYLAPTPYRGRRNEPAYVVEVCKALAELFDWTIEETAQKTTDAFFNLFTKADRPI